MTPSQPATVARTTMTPGRGSPPAGDRVDRDSTLWLRRLRSEGAVRDTALDELHALLLRAATFEVQRRRSASLPLRGGEAADIAQQSADDALVAVLHKLDRFRGDSRFTTWAYKFALYEAAANMRKQAWRGREIPVTAEEWPAIADTRPAPERDVEMAELLAAVREEIEAVLSPHQREVLIALALNEVPIDVLAERLGTSRGALYKSLHDARRKLRAALAKRGLGPGPDPGGSTR
jgi:RNA polymerase sigma-70 factor (ECF subfamily)